MSIKGILLAGCALAMTAGLGATAANAATTVSDGAYTVGIGPNGELYDYNSGIGFQRVADGYDPLAPGSPRDSWGVTTSAGSAYADQADFGQSNIVGTAIAGGGGGATANALTVTSVGVNVDQSYNFVGAGNILKITETITNTSGTYLTGVEFARDVDWDVAPTEFDENTFGPTGASAAVIDSSYYGFENPTAGVPYGSSCFAGCNFTADLGGGIQVALGNLAPGASDTISYYYGVNSSGETVNGLNADAFAAGASYLISTQSSENGAYPSLGENSALIGVGGVPEPATWAMFLLGIGGIGAAMRVSRRKQADAVATA